MKLVVFDLATQTGWARLDTEPEGGVFSFEGDAPAPVLTSGTKSFKLQGWEGDVDRNAKAERFFDEKLRGAGVAYYERILFQHRSMAAARVYFGLETVLELACKRMGVACKFAKPSDIKTEALGPGKSNRKKGRMLELARIQFSDQRVLDDNQADALWLMRWAARREGIELSRHVEELPL